MSEREDKGVDRQDNMNGMTLPNHIETLFKAEPPFSPVANGHGFLGVVLLDKTEDTIQCHICGRWLKLLGTHLKSAHGTTTDKYKQTFGLPMGFPLCSRGFSQRHSEAASRPERLQHLAAVRDPSKLRKSWRIQSKLSKYGRNNAAFKNSHGLCADQMLRRYLIVADFVGREPSQGDLQKHDRSVWRAINRQHRNLNAFRRLHGFDVVPRAKLQSEDSVIAHLLKRAIKLKRAPRSGDFHTGTPVLATIRKYCGSFHRAMEMAGFDRQSEPRLWSRNA